MSYCEDCGELIPDNFDLCPGCFESQENSDINLAGSLYWKGQIPIVTSSVVVKQLALAFGVGALGLFLIFFFIDPIGSLIVLPGIFIIWLALYGLSLLVGGILQGATKGGPEGMFAITPEGVGYSAGATLKKLNRLLVVGSASGGSLSGTGAAMMNISRETDTIKWDDVRSITFQDRERTILIYRKIIIQPIFLACTEQNYETAKNLIYTYARPETIK